MVQLRKIAAMFGKEFEPALAGPTTSTTTAPEIQTPVHA